MTEASTTIPALALAAVLTYAAITKVVRPAEWSTALAGYRFGRAEPLMRGLVPASEAAVAATCVASPVLGARLALALLAAMAVAVLRAARGRIDGRLPCGCFGGTAERSAQALLLRIGALGGVAAVTLAGPGLWSDVEPLPALLVLVGVTVAGATIGLWRHASKDFVRR
ncbi:MAG TPA: MauE/DoxX family redox-associated membrane protein [Actinomycetota bacterium]|nr:MauE/DoxX family redox-associated membrane protein [Actinomycetota bacterium]